MKWKAKYGGLEVSELVQVKELVACNSDIGIALMYHEACLKESFA
jgi:hypothetical protein